MSFVVSMNADLQAFNGMGVSAQAAYLSSIESIDDIVAARKFIEQKKIPLMVLGEGSNTLFTRDYPGLIVHNKFKGIELLGDSADSVNIRVGGGENWHQFVSTCVQNGWYGLENLALIPGLVGAAPIQNIGAYGVEVKDSISVVHYYDLEDQQLRSLSNKECLFNYRDSVFKRDLANRAIVTSVEFRLNKRALRNIEYPALREYFSRRPAPNPEEVFSAVCHIRNAKLPLPSAIPNLGSFFKNPVISEQAHAKLQKKHRSIVSFEVENGFKLAAGWLIDEAGWKQKILDDVAVHHEQALVIINPLGASGKSVIGFARAVQDDIKRKFGVLLEIEPQIV